MSHPTPLIEKIKGLLEQDYPYEGFVYVVEKALPGTRLFPDITIRNATTNKIHCVVEIGYTRPEKITAYLKTHRIPDVRWYDKSGTLHTEHQKIQTFKTVELVPVGWFSIYGCYGAAVCWECRRQFTEAVFDRYARRFGQTRADQCAQELEENAREIWTAIVTDGIRFFLPSLCDECVNSFTAADDEADALWSDLEEGLSNRELAERFGARLFHGGWDDTKHWVMESFGLELDYADGGKVRERS